MKGQSQMQRCWQCGGKLDDPFGRPVKGVQRILPLGEIVRLHKICALTFDEQDTDRKITARPTAETPYIPKMKLG